MLVPEMANGLRDLDDGEELLLRGVDSDVSEGEITAVRSQPGHESDTAGARILVEADVAGELLAHRVGVHSGRGQVLALRRHHDEAMVGSVRYNQIARQPRIQVDAVRAVQR